MTQHTPTLHSTKVGGSSAARVIACPASMRLVQTMPDAPESEYAAEGTALHNAVEHCLYEGLSPEDARGLIGKEFYGVTMTQAHIHEALIPAIEMFDAFLEEMEETDGDVITYAVEQRVHMPGIEDGFGTADILLVTPKRTVVWDWKFGAGIPVEAKNNRQMAFYARAAAYSAKEFFWPHPEQVPDDEHPGPDFDDWSVEFVIAQPRINPEAPSRWLTTFSVLEEFRGSLIEAIEQAQMETPPYARGEHCRFCGAKPICPLYKDVAEKLARATSTEPELPVPPHDPFTPADLRDWLRMADIVEEWAKGVRALAMSEAEMGRPPKGSKLVEKQGNLAWTETDPTRIDGVLARRGLSLEERRKPWVPITPTQAIAKLKKLGKTLPDDYTKRPVTGVALVGLDDKRPALRSVADKMSEASEKLDEAKKLAEASKWATGEA